MQFFISMNSFIEEYFKINLNIHLKILLKFEIVLGSFMNAALDVNRKMDI